MSLSGKAGGPAPGTNSSLDTLNAWELKFDNRQSAGAFLAADLMRSDQTGRDYQMSIPAGMPVKLWVFSRP